MKRPENIKKLRRMRQLRIFSIFILLTFTAWFFQKLSKDYTEIVKVNLQFNQTNKTRFLSSTNDLSSYVKVKTNGFNLLYFKLFNKNITLNTQDLKKTANNRFYYLPNRNLSFLNQQWANIIQFQQDTIWIAISGKTLKKVPVVNKAVLHCKSGFRMLQNITIQPDSVIISGTAQDIRNINYIETQVVTFENINSDFSKNLLLNSNFDKNTIDIEPRAITISVPVARITEQTYILPISIINPIRDKKVVLLPDMAKLKIQMTYKQAVTWSETDFELACKLPIDTKSAYQKLELFLVKKPENVLDYRIVPPYIDYYTE